MRLRAIVLAVVALALIVPAATASAADASWRRADVVFLLLPGFGSTVPAAEGADVFGPLVGELEKRGWPARQSAPFGYAGELPEGGPAPHGCEATEAGLAAAEAQLRATIAARRSANPNARFVLVGHSLGGLVAWWHLHRLAEEGAADPAVVGAIAVDSPLHGVDPWKLLLLAMSCGGDTRTLDDLAALYADREAWRARWVDVAGWARERGLHVRSVGNRQDCYYWPTLCGVPAFTAWDDDRESQLVAGASTAIDVPIEPAWGEGPFSRAIVSHRAVLDAEPHAAAIAALADRAAQPRPTR